MPMKSKDGSLIPRRIVMIDLLIITSMWCVSLCVINPLGHFPLNDDWSYGLTVRHLIENGGFHPTANTAMPLVTNVLWGSLFCIPTGFSFTALRLSTLTASLLGIILVYLLMRDICQTRWRAVITAVTLASNPIYYALSNTFMTDNLYIAITLAAALFFARDLRDSSGLDLVMATTLAIAATLSRQLAIAVPLSFALCVIVRRGCTRANILRGAMPVLVCVVALVTFQHWLAESRRLPAEYNVKIQGLFGALSSPKTLVLVLVKNTFVGLLYLGLFLLPVLVLAFVDVWQSHRRQVTGILTAALATMVLGIAGFALLGLHPAVTGAGSYPVTYLMPMSANVLMNSGIGPIMLPDSWIGLHYVPSLPSLPTTFWFLVTVMSVIGAGLLTTTFTVRAFDLVPRLGVATKISVNEVVGIFFVLSAMIGLLPIVASSFIDRYLIPPVPLFATGLACICGGPRQSCRVNARVLHLSAVAVLIGFSLFAIGSTRDYLEWNRLRWAALHDLVDNDHVDVKDIDGGLEFNGLYMYKAGYQYNPSKNWWWVQGNTYQICFGGMPGYRIIKQYSYHHWIPAHIGRVVVLEKRP